MFPKRNKYGAKRVTIDNVTFDSKGEAERYQILKILLNSKQISNLTIHPRYWIFVNGAKAFQYEADFEYKDHNGKEIVEDVKGYILPMAKLKMKCFKLQYPDKTLIMLRNGKKIE